MDTLAMERFSYGLFVLTTREGDKDNGCIINTAIQAALVPNTICLSVNKEVYTHEMLMRTGVCTLSILSEDAAFSVYQRFGFQSGREVDKFAGYAGCKRGRNGILYVTEGTNAYIGVRVTKTLDLGSHTLFVGEVTEMEQLRDVESVTYAYYQKHVKPQRTVSQETSKGQTVWVCKVCGYEYVGENLPEDFICPWCKHPASDFEKVVR